MPAAKRTKRLKRKGKRPKNYGKPISPEVRRRLKDIAAKREDEALYSTVIPADVDETWLKGPFDETKGERIWLKLGFYRKRKNKKHRKPGKPWSDFTGVYWNESKGMWEAAANYWVKQSTSPKKIHIGYYETELGASIAYDEFCIKTVKRLCGLNHPQRVGGDISPRVVRMKAAETQLDASEAVKVLKQAKDETVDTFMDDIEFDFGFGDGEDD